MATMIRHAEYTRARSMLHRIPSRLLAFFILLTVGITISSAKAAPKRLILIRHGNKNLSNTSQNLNPKGFTRSINLAYMLLGCFGKPSAIYVHPIDNNKPRSHQREYQTAVPLAVATQENIRFLWQAKQGTLQAGKALRALPASQYPLVVVIWHYWDMPELAKGLGWSEMETIDRSDFNHLFEFNYNGGASTPIVRRHTESELFKKTCASSPNGLEVGPRY